MNKSSPAKRKIAETDDGLHSELEDISDSIAYLVGDAGVPRIATEMSKVADVLENALGLQGVSLRGTLVAQMSRTADAVEELCRLENDQQEAAASSYTASRCFYVHREPDTGRVTTVIPTDVANPLSTISECDDDWDRVLVELPRIADDSQWWSVCASDGDGIFRLVGCFASHGLAVEQCRQIWRQVHANAAPVPAWVAKRHGKGLRVPLRITERELDNVVSLVVMPPTITHDVEVFTVK